MLDNNYFKVLKVNIIIYYYYIGLLRTYLINLFSFIVKPWPIDFCNPPLSLVPIIRSPLFFFIYSQWLLLYSLLFKRLTNLVVVGYTITF